MNNRSAIRLAGIWIVIPLVGSIFVPYFWALWPLTYLTYRTIIALW